MSFMEHSLAETTASVTGGRGFASALFQYAYSVLVSIIVFGVFVALGFNIEGGIFFGAVAGFIFAATLTAC